MSEDGHSVAILDVHGVRMEWNGDDYVSVEGGEGGGAAGAGEAGGPAGRGQPQDTEERDSDQYLESGIVTAYHKYIGG